MCVCVCGCVCNTLSHIELVACKDRELCKNVRIIFQVCRLVHGDLSEYNILYYEGRAYIIDVSQSVEHDHPRALEFLREDCDHLNSFFRQK